MPAERLVIGTRGSRLAMAQSAMVAGALARRFPDVEFELKKVVTRGDASGEKAIAAMGEGIFVKEIEEALLAGECDLAVHSVKDMPVDPDSSLLIAAVVGREDARDVLVSRSGRGLTDLEEGAVVGTSSPGRSAQLLHLRPGLAPRAIRGNVDTRIRKLEAGGYDAVVLAAAGLIRLGLESAVTQYLPFSMMLPAPGQGALAVQARRDDRRAREIAAFLDDRDSRLCVEAERTFLRELGGGCSVPVAAHAHISGGRVSLSGLAAGADGKKVIRRESGGPAEEASLLAKKMAADLIAAGALELLTRPPVYSDFNRESI